MKIEFDVIKILAAGTNDRFMTIELEGQYKAVRITDPMYRILKEKGVPTAQALSRKKEKK